MIINPLITMQIRPAIYSFIKQSRNLRPTVKIAKDKFQISIDVRQFSKDEIRVKAVPEYVVVEGKQEKTSKKGLVMRQFVRKFKLPCGCNPNTIESHLSPEGILTITAPRKSHDASFPCETLVPIAHSGPQKTDDNIVLVEDIKKTSGVVLNKCEPNKKK